MRTLRYYDEIGLLKPVRVDQDSGYRYYSMDQLPRLHRILAFKDLGFELSQVMQLLHENVPPIQIRGMLRLKQIELQQRVQAEQERLTRVETRLKQIESDDTGLTREVSIKKVRPQIVALSRKITADATIKAQFAHEMRHLLLQHGIQQVAPLLYIEHEHTYNDQGLCSVEVAIPVHSSSVGNIVEISGGRITVRELPGINTMASLVHHGNPFSMIETYQALGSWLQLHDYTITGHSREICLKWEEDPDASITEIQFPVEKNDDRALAGKRFLFTTHNGKEKISPGD